MEAGWAKNRPAKSKDSHRSLLPTDPRAARFCIIGAVDRAQFELSGPLGQYETMNLSLRLLDAVAHTQKGRPLTSFNDDWKTSKKQVLALFDAACERVGKG